MKIKLLSVKDNAGNPRMEGFYAEMINRPGEVLLMKPTYKMVIQMDPATGDYMPFTLRTSEVKDVKRTGDTITVKTANSVYLLEVISA
jgi:hypothetical protein